ncbi:MAG: Gfo/Idh/MocA family oxidoreductase [Planctomycetia bacterium]|nr:Gfo/Idh/MocA family oxidoreductase [Planctomycetia bacterium]RLT13727.1 MAG: gfo/Idh/MocA family oxidoreductase [Planctomycetota bacterium]
MKKYNVGMIGYGWAAAAHIAAINATKQGQVRAVYSSRPQDAALLTQKHSGNSAPAIQVYQDLDQMLADPSLDVVDITSYPSEHRDQAVAAANAKKHIILEKPMANSATEVADIVAAASANGVMGCVCFECRFSSQFQSIKAVVDEGLLGQLHYGEIDYYHGIGPWYGQFRWNTFKKEGGSALLTAGCHALDALLMLMGTEVESVSSMSTRSQSDIFAPYEYDTSSVTILRFKNGAIGKTAAIVDCLQPYYFHTHLVGSQGSILDNKFHSQKLKTDKGHWSELAMKMLDSGDVSDHPYQSQFQAFFDALDAGVEMPLTSFSEAAKTFAIIFAADASAANAGQCVTATSFQKVT